MRDLFFRSPDLIYDEGNGSLPWKYTGVSLSSPLSLILLAGSLQPNRTYQLMVYLESKRNHSSQGTGYLLVRVEKTFPKMIAIGYSRTVTRCSFHSRLFSCVITSLCIPNLEFQLINPTTQVSLFALCTGNCSIRRNITWNIYHGVMNSSGHNLTHWTLFNQMNLYQNIWFFGKSSSRVSSALSSVSSRCEHE